MDGASVCHDPLSHLQCCAVPSEIKCAGKLNSLGYPYYCCFFFHPPPIGVWGQVWKTKILYCVVLVYIVALCFKYYVAPSPPKIRQI